ncbi:MAG: RNA polymerase sigma factor [Chloroflexota bacterium]
MDDRALVRAVLDGDRDAFRPVVEREATAVYRACLRILGEPADAEDVAQESMVIGYRSLATFRGDGPLGAWLVRIATRQAYRRVGQRRNAVDLAAIPEPAGSGPSSAEPLGTLIASERATELRAGVAALPEPYRETVALRFFGELALDEIAAATGRPLNTVKTHLRRGLERLRVAVGRGQP